MAGTINSPTLFDRLRHGPPIAMLDVRSAAEFAIGHIPGAMNIPMEQIENRMADVPAGPLVMVCEAGKRAEIVAGWLGDQEHLSVLEGGTRAWRNAEYPVVACAPCRWTLERQVRLIAGLIVLIATLLAVFLNPNWIYAAMFIGAGLTFAGVTNICGMGMLLAKMPWNVTRGTAGRATNAVNENCCS
jgi:rhodanese-related sulfurtransferase